MKKLYGFLVLGLTMTSLADFSENAVLCKSKSSGKQYAAFVEDCDREKQESACNTKAGVADPVACKLFTSEAEADKFWAENPMSGLLECKNKASGLGFRYIAPDCSEGTKKDICTSEYLEVTGCKVFDDQKELMKEQRTHINRAYVTCLIEAADTKTDYEVPARDCEPETQKAACVGGKPTTCEIRKI